MGYKKKGSQASLRASGGVATALLVAAALMGGPYHSIGLALALGALYSLRPHLLFTSKVNAPLCVHAVRDTKLLTL